jgi:hypothetical protein
MELALLGYTLLNLTILGAVLWFVRASRARAVPDERPDLEENALVAADWELVRRERCLPSGCRRVRGQPPRPRKDITCEVCAATFLEVRLQQLLELPSVPKQGLSELPRARETTYHGANVPCAHAVEESPHSRSHAGRLGGTRTHRAALTAARWALLRLALGVICVSAGAAIALFGGLHFWIVPGYLTVFVGLALIVSGALSGAL